MIDTKALRAIAENTPESEWANRFGDTQAIALLDEVDRLRADLSGSLCVECGPDVNVDEDGCCTMCGGTALGTWLFRKHAELAAVGRTRGTP